MSETKNDVEPIANSAHEIPRTQNYSSFNGTLIVPKARARFARSIGSCTVPHRKESSRGITLKQFQQSQGNPRGCFIFLDFTFSDYSPFRKKDNFAFGQPTSAKRTNQRYTRDSSSVSLCVKSPYISYIPPRRQRRASRDQYDCRCVRIPAHYGNKALPSSAGNAYVPPGYP